MKYRPEIDGLRAIAVLPVILFHSGLGLSGGFVGVDIFFVISGFLICLILMEEREKTGSISIVGFYERRARRIIPALTLVLLASLPFAWFWMMPDELELFGRSLVSAMLFYSNMFFWSVSGYFSPRADLMPLLHTWSLAVEEQYYLIFPVALVLAWRMGRHWFFVSMMFALCGSFAIGEWSSHHKPSVAFYFFPTRAWELLTGAVLAYWTFRKKPPEGIVAEIVSVVGLSAIIFALFFFDEDTPWSGSLTLVPVLGAAMVLWAGGGTFVGHLLSWRPLVGIGLISYSAYLWHQPIFAFTRLRSEEEPTPELMMALSVTTLILAWLSWRFVELPFRNRRWIGRSNVFGGAITAMIATSVFGVWMIALQGAPGRYPDWQRSWLVPPEGGFSDFVMKSYMQELDPIEENPAENAILIVGDSFSQDFYNILRRTDLTDGLTLHRHYIENQCQPIMANRRTPAIAETQGKANCQTAAISPSDISRMARYESVLLAPNWKDWSIDEGIAIAKSVKSAGGRVIAVGPKRFREKGTPNKGLRPYAGRPLYKLLSMRAPLPGHTNSIDNRLRYEFGEDDFISIVDVLCEGSSVKSCRLTTDEGAPISYDGVHLTPQGADYIGALLSAEISAKLFPGTD